MVSRRSRCRARDFGETVGPRHPADRGDCDVDDPFRRAGARSREPQWCGIVTAFLALSGNRRNSIMAGGNGLFGRRDFVWQAGRTGVRATTRRNMLGFSTDFAEDVTKSNWGVEFTWVDDVHVAGQQLVQRRLEQTRHLPPHDLGGPADLHQLPEPEPHVLLQHAVVLPATPHGYERRLHDRRAVRHLSACVTVGTGYFQDRLLPSLTVVYFVMNNSLAVLPAGHLPLHRELLGDVRHRRLLRPRPGAPMELDEPRPSSSSFGRNAYKTLSAERPLADPRARRDLPAAPVHVLGEAGRREPPASAHRLQ